MHFHKIEKALMEAMLFLGTVCGTARYAEDEIEELIRHTESVLQELDKPRIADDATEKQKQEWLRASAEMRRYLQTPALIEAASENQAAKIEALSKRLPSEAAKLGTPTAAR